MCWTNYLRPKYFSEMKLTYKRKWQLFVGALLLLLIAGIVYIYISHSVENSINDFYFNRHKVR